MGTVIKKLYGVGAVYAKHKAILRQFGREETHDIELIWADGMIGVMPIFETEEAAKKYAAGKSVVIEIGADWGRSDSK